MSPSVPSCDLARLLRRLRDCDAAFCRFTCRTASVVLVARGWQANATLRNAALGGNLPTHVEKIDRGRRWTIGWPDDDRPPDAFERFTHFGICLVWWLAEDRRIANDDAERLLRQWKGESLAARRKWPARRHRRRR